MAENTAYQYLWTMTWTSPFVTDLIYNDSKKQITGLF